MALLTLMAAATVVAANGVTVMGVWLERKVAGVDTDLPLRAVAEHQVLLHQREDLLEPVELYVPLADAEAAFLDDVAASLAGGNISNGLAKSLKSMNVDYNIRRIDFQKYTEHGFENLRLAAMSDCKIGNRGSVTLKGDGEMQYGYINLVCSGEKPAQTIPLVVSFDNHIPVKIYAENPVPLFVRVRD